MHTLTHTQHMHTDTHARTHAHMQMSINPADGDMIIIEMNPRVSRSSALASKATGFPIAKFAAKLSVGYTLDQVCGYVGRVCVSPSDSSHMRLLLKDQCSLQPHKPTRGYKHSCLLLVPFVGVRVCVLLVSIM
jgi:hypothetical protein